MNTNVLLHNHKFQWVFFFLVKHSIVCFFFANYKPVNEVWFDDVNIIFPRIKNQGIQISQGFIIACDCPVGSGFSSISPYTCIIKILFKNKNVKNASSMRPSTRIPETNNGGKHGYLRLNWLCYTGNKNLHQSSADSLEIECVITYYCCASSSSSLSSLSSIIIITHNHHRVLIVRSAKAGEHKCQRAVYGSEVSSLCCHFLKI